MTLFCERYDSGTSLLETPHCRGVLVSGGLGYDVIVTSSSIMNDVHAVILKLSLFVFS